MKILEVAKEMAENLEEQSYYFAEKHPEKN